MRLVLDTNVVIAGLLWAGHPRHLIVSGDRHLHGLGGQYQGIPIVTPAQAMQQIGA